MNMFKSWLDQTNDPTTISMAAIQLFQKLDSLDEDRRNEVIKLIREDVRGRAVFEKFAPASA